MHCRSFVAGPIMRQLQEESSGYPAILSCGYDPVEPVRWKFQSSPDSVVTGITSSERFVIRGSSLVIYSVEASDSGLYNCTDVAGELHRAIQLNVLGKFCRLFFTTSC